LKNFLKENGLWVLFAAAVIAVGLAALSYFSNTSPLENLIGTVTSPFRTAYSSVANWAADKQNYYEDTKALKQENEDLKKQIADMQDQIRQAKSDSEENKRLRELLNLQEQRRDLQTVSAFVTEQSPSNWTSSLTLNQGTDSDVKTGDCVITEAGYLVGVVDAAGQNWCTVLTVLDTDTSLGAKVFRTNDLGIASGDFNLMSQGRLKLSYLPSGSQLLNGDQIVTSGQGGFYPSGLIIGTVEEVKLDDSGATSYAVLKPSADIPELTEVFIVKSFDIVD